MSSANNAAIDYAHLKVQAADDTNVMREVLALFLVHTEQVLEQLSVASDERTWKQLTHTLKGSARAVGAFALADAAAAAERAVLDKAAIAAAKAAFEAARNYIAGNPM